MKNMKSEIETIEAKWEAVLAPSKALAKEAKEAQDNGNSAAAKELRAKAKAAKALAVVELKALAKKVMPVGLRAAKETCAIFVSHSGGKDSQALLATVRSLGYAAKIIVVHANLGSMEHEHMVPFIEANSFGLPVNEVEADEDFFFWSKKYNRIPGNQQRFCTDKLKVIPIAEFIHKYMYEHNIDNAINATGIRAEESGERAVKCPLTISEMTQVKKHPTHLIVDWMPIFEMTEADVWQCIKAAGQRPHDVYFKGFTRLSCAFCVLGKIAEQQLAAQLYPEKLAEMEQLEKDLGKTIRTKTVAGKQERRPMSEYVHDAIKEKDQAEMDKHVANIKKIFD